MTAGVLRLTDPGKSFVSDSITRIMPGSRDACADERVLFLKAANTVISGHR